MSTQEGVTCPVTGGPCVNAACTSAEPGCEAAADEILWLEPEKIEAATESAAARLNLDPALFADFVTDKGLGPGASVAFGSETGTSPFQDL